MKNLFLSDLNEIAIEEKIIVCQFCENENENELKIIHSQVGIEKVQK